MSDIEILHLSEHGLQVRLPSGREFGFAFYPPKEAGQPERVVVTDLSGDAGSVVAFGSRTTEGTP